MPLAFLLTLLLAPPPDAFTRLQSLAGDWEAKNARGSVVRVNYRLVANDSALVETWRTPSGRETLTIYHPDGARLLLTHYCAQGNQPRLALTKSAGDELTFTFVDATNLASAGASHLVRATLHFDGVNAFDKSETYANDGKEETEVLHFRRAQ